MNGKPTTTAALLLVIVWMLASPAQAAVVKLSFSGTYDTGELPIFGLLGEAVPYDFELTYDTALDSNPLFFGTGAILGGLLTTHEWHAYSASGVTAASLIFGSQNWTAGDLSPRFIEDASADLWFDTDISLATPTKSFMFFVGGSPGLGTLQLGEGVSNGVNIFMQQKSFVVDDDGFGLGFSSLMTITPVPEPATFALAGLGVLALAGRKRGRRM